MSDRMHGVPIHRVWDAELRTFIDVTDEPKGGPVTDAPRRTRLEWVEIARKVWRATVGRFTLEICGHEDGAFGWFDWSVFCERKNRDRASLALLVNENTLEDAQLAAESWLAEAVREPAERLITPPQPDQ